MNDETPERGGHGFAIGLLTGACVGAGLALWLAPRFSRGLRQRLTRSARDLGERATDRYEKAASRVVDVVEEVTRKGQRVRDDVAEAVAHGAHEVSRGAHEVARTAHEVERFATAAKSDRRR